MNCIRVQYPADRTSTRHASTMKIYPSTPEPRAPLPGSNSVSEVRPLCRLKESIIHSVRRLCGLHQQEAHSRQAVRPPPVGKETCFQRPEAPQAVSQECVLSKAAPRPAASLSTRPYGIGKGEGPSKRQVSISSL